MTDAIFLQVSGKAYWTQVHKANKYDKYSITLELDDEAAFVKDVLTKYKVKSDFQKDKETGEYSKSETGNRFFTIRKNSVNQKGETLKAPTVVDAQLRAIPATVAIGNGSKVKVNFAVNERHDIKGAHSLKLVGVQVLDLVPYEGTTNTGFTAETGYTVTAEDDIVLAANE